MRADGGLSGAGGLQTPIMLPPKSDLASAGLSRVRAPRRARPAAVDAGGKIGDPWAEVPAILARIKSLTFPARDCVATAYGTVGDGRTDDHAALLRAINACADQGGGRVVVPPGEYLTGPLHLGSRVNLHLCAGATLRFVTDSCRYLPPVPTRWEGVECMGLSPLVYACDREHVASPGAGILDGQAGPGRWWHWAGPWDAPGRPAGRRGGRARRGRAALQHWAAAGFPCAERDLDRDGPAPTHGPRVLPLPGRPGRGRHVRNTPMWGIHPVFCRAVTVRRVRCPAMAPTMTAACPTPAATS